MIAKLSNFQGVMAYPIALKMSQNITKFMNKLVGVFQQGGYLYKPASGIQRTSEDSWRSYRLQKQTSEKVDHIPVKAVLWHLASLLMELSIGNENHSLTFVHM